MASSLPEEEAPLLRTEERTEGRPDSKDSSLLIDFDPDGDPDNPLEWPTSFKWTIVTLMASMAFMAYVDR